MYDIMIQKIKIYLKKCLSSYIQRKKVTCRPINIYRYNNKLDDLRFYVKSNNASVKKIQKIPVKSQAQYKWVGAQITESNNLFGIVNGATEILKCSNIQNHLEYFGKLPKQSFKWTGGCYYNKYIYEFPRSTNELLRVDVEKESVQLLPLQLNYGSEHHYGGVLTKNGIIYQPPRNTDHILAIDLKTLKCHRVLLAPQWMKLKFRYCGSVLHPNGYIYFLPERGQKVIRFNPDTEDVSYMGGILDCMVFDATVALDGNIYGFSAYSRGILKIDIENDRTEMIHQDFSPGCYGTKLGPNGKLYGIPGDGNDFWEFDIEKDVIKSAGGTAESEAAKCAGGAVDHNGDIYCVPAKGNYLYKICFEGVKGKIPDELYDIFYVDFY